MAARMIEVQTDTDPPFHTRSTPPPPAWSPDTLYALLLAHGRYRADVNRPVTVYGEIVDLWVRALRSGRYLQHHGNWHYRDAVCAVEVILHELGYKDSGPRNALIAKVGFDLCSVVMALNDRQRWSFKQIAEWLETCTKPVSSEEWYLTSLQLAEPSIAPPDKAA